MCGFSWSRDWRQWSRLGRFLAEDVQKLLFCLPNFGLDLFEFFERVFPAWRLEYIIKFILSGNTLPTGIESSSKIANKIEEILTLFFLLTFPLRVFLEAMYTASVTLKRIFLFFPNNLTIIKRIGHSLFG